MVRIGNLLEGISFEGSFGNLKKPILQLEKIDVENLSLIFCFAHDYSTNLLGYDEETAKKIISEQPSMSFIGGSYCKVSISLSKKDMAQFITDIIVFSFSVDKEILLKEETVYGNILFEKNSLNSNIGCCCSTLSYFLQTEYSYYNIIIDAACRISGTVCDIVHIQQKFCDYARKLKIEDKVSSAVLKALKIKEMDINNLCECFDYEVISDTIVLLHLKSSINPKHLLRFDGFNSGYTDFKVSVNGSSGTFTCVKENDYFTIEFGNTTTCCPKYYWTMKEQIIRCIRIKLLLF